jgi:SAM-dependent methyltransferase
MVRRLSKGSSLRLGSIVRRLAAGANRLLLSATGRWFDRVYLAPDVPPPDRAGHLTLVGEVVALADKPGYRVLEIGAREVSTGYTLRKRLQHATYVGFDYYPGPNVDVTGDAHRLSSYFDEPFDAIYSTAVFEHLAMPWLVAEEIAKLLKVGGHLFIETHFSHSSHERPWHFFQFSDMALRALFSPALGFECLEASLDTPIVGRFSAYAAPYLRFQPVPALYCHSLFLGRKVRDVPGFRWADADIDAVVGATRYPPPQ